jgi:transcriptional regulator with XRE-family HTH domain
MIVKQIENKDFFKEIGKRIAQYRKEQDLTQEQLAEKLGITQSVLAHYETGIRRIPLSTIPSLSQILFVSVEEILGLPLKKKRGPSPKIQKILQQLQNLPLSKQKLALELIDTIIRDADKKVS